MEPLRRVFRGYEPAQVDRLISDYDAKLDGLRREVELLRNQSDGHASENASLKNAMEEVAAKEQAVKDALVSAHRQAEDILAAARQEAELLLQVARETGVRMQEDLRGRIDDLNWQVEKLALRKEKFAAEFRGLLEGYLQSLSEPEGATLFSPSPESAVVEAPAPAEEAAESAS